MNRKSYQLSLEGSEEDKRLFYKNMLYKETTGNFLNINHISELFNNIDLLELKNVLTSISDHHGFQLEGVSVPRILMHLGISLERMLSGNYAPVQIAKDVAIDPIIYDVVQEFFVYLQQTYHIEITESEVKIFTILLMGKQGLSTRQSLDQDRSLLITEIVNQIIDDLDKTFAINVEADEEFKLGL